MRAAGPTPLSDPRAARAPPAGLLLLLLLAAAVFLAALLIGSSDIGLRAALAALGGSGDAATRSVLIGVRLPRVLALGIGCEREHTLEEIGQEFDVTRERIRQIEAKALRQLRAPERARRLRALMAAR